MAKNYTEADCLGKLKRISEEVDKMQAENKTLKKENEEIRNQWHIDLNDKASLQSQVEALEEQTRWHKVEDDSPETDKEHPFRSIEVEATDGETVWICRYNFSALYWQCPSGDITSWRYIVLPDTEKDADAETH